MNKVHITDFTTPMQGVVNLPTRIYVLRDPRDQSVKYVGKTIAKLVKRLNQHIENAFDWKSGDFRSKKSAWIRHLFEENHFPIIEQIDFVESNWAEREIYWINHYSQMGCDLVNTANVSNAQFLRLDYNDHVLRYMEAKSKALTWQPKLSPAKSYFKHPPVPERQPSRMNVAPATQRAMDELMTFFHSEKNDGMDEICFDVFYHVVESEERGITLRDLSRTAIGKNSENRVMKALDDLVRHGFAKFVRLPTKGRPRIAYVAMRYITH